MCSPSANNTAVNSSHLFQSQLTLPSPTPIHNKSSQQNFAVSNQSFRLQLNYSTAVNNMINSVKSISSSSSTNSIPITNGSIGSHISSVKNRLNPVGDSLVKSQQPYPKTQYSISMGMHAAFYNIFFLCFFFCSNKINSINMFHNSRGNKSSIRW